MGERLVAGAGSEAAVALPRRLLAALPDLLTAAVATWGWFDPSGWRHALVGYAVLMMLVEFVLIHASGLFGMAITPGQAHPLSRRLLVGVLLFYLVLVGGFAWDFGDPWVFAGAAWLLLAKAWPLLGGDRTRISQAQRAMWGASIVYYLLAVAATVLLPVPRLGITGHGGDYDMAGQGGLWASQPHTAIAALAIYFLLLGLTRLAGWDQRWGRYASASGPH